MPFALSFVGLMLVIVGFQDTYRPFGKLVAGDFTGKNNFIYWMAAILSVGILGYVKDLETFSRAFMVLIIVSLILAQNKNAGSTGLFGKLQEALSSGTANASNQIGAELQGQSGGGNSAGGSGGFDLQNVAQIAEVAAMFA